MLNHLYTIIATYEAGQCSKDNAYGMSTSRTTIVYRRFPWWRRLWRKLTR